MKSIANLCAVKKTGLVFVFLEALFVLFHGQCLADVPKREDYGDCLFCHHGIEQISEPHGFACADCHLRPRQREKPIKTHSLVVRNPSSPDNVREFCLPCHKRDVDHIEKSLHSTMAGIINQTRYLWGAQKACQPPIYGLSGGLVPLPEPQDLALSPDNPGLLVDDFLRRRCLRCHIGVRGMQAYGLYRASGCAACHIIYENDGTYRGGDNAIDKKKKGYPAYHRFTRKIPIKQCLHCHNQNNVGADYVGLFEHDYHKTYRSLRYDGAPLKKIYGMDHHYLAKDVHFLKGLACIDCHRKDEVMGDGKIYSHVLGPGKIRCSDCHGGFHLPGPLPSIKNITRDQEGYYFHLKVNQMKVPLRTFSRNHPSHDPGLHSRVRCSACHAQWSYQDYGLSVIREDVVAPHKWYGLEQQGDPYLEGVLRRTVNANGDTYPVTLDWVSGKDRLGLWSVGWRFRRWEYLPLGIDHTGRYAIVRPKYQFLVSYVNELGIVVLDSFMPQRGDGSGMGWCFTPYVPHTTGKRGRACGSCHGSQSAVGNGIMDTSSADTALGVAAPPAISSMRLLTRDEKTRLLNPSYDYHRIRLRWTMLN